MKLSSLSLEAATRNERSWEGNVASAPRLAMLDSTFPREGSVRLVLADELTLMREGLAAICVSSPRFQVVGQTSNGLSAVHMIQELRPDIAVLDMNLPALHTLEVVRQVRSSGLSTRIAVLSTRGDRKTVLEALRGGVNAFLLKSGPSKHLLDSFEQILEGGVYISPLLKMDEIFFSTDRLSPGDPFDSLSPREFQVFTLLVEGLRPKEIGLRLTLSPKTVDTYRSSLMQKLDIHDVAGLVKYAMHREFIA